MIGIIKGIFYMVFVLVIAQIVNFLYNFLLFYFKKQTNIKSDESKSLSMLQCSKCKVYISKSEAYIVDGKIFCKKEHSD